MLIKSWARVNFFAVAALAAPALRGNLGIHDPSTIIKCKNRYYIFGTGQGIISKSSANKIFWAGGPTVFSAAPAWTTNAAPGFTGFFWAPDIFYVNGEYRLYYAVSIWGSQVSVIGLATNPTLDPTDPTYHWTDHGPVIQSGSGSPYNAIDPSVALDATGNPWMSFGSYWNGIYVIQLDPNSGLRLAPTSPAYRVAWNSSIEASCLFQRGSYYYLFADWGSCCIGVNSTYNVRVGRSTSITGPYLDRNGVDMVNGGGTLFLQGTGKFTGPGHMGILSENGAQQFSYHYYDAGAWSPGYNAYGMPDFDLEPLLWTADNWPVFTNGWSAVYHFKADARDENGQYYGLLQGGASIQTDAVRGNVLNLNGNNQYVALPAGVGSMQTFAGWVKWYGGGAWQRVFDFGQDTTRWVFLTPMDPIGNIQCAITTENANFVQVIEGPAALPVNTWTHVAVVFDGRQGVLYTNGQVAAINNSVNLLPSDVGGTGTYFGRSQFPADPYFNGRLDSVKLNSRPLSLASLVAPAAVITQPMPGELYSGGDVVAYAGNATDFSDAPLPATSLAWSAVFHHDGQLDSVFGPVTGITNGPFQIPTTGPLSTNVFYRLNLLVVDTNGNQNSVTADVLPKVGTPNFDTVPAGLQVSLDSQPLTTPASASAVAGLTRTLAAPPTQTLAGSNYSFVVWSDGGGASHPITVPARGASYTASYVPPAVTFATAPTYLVLGWPAWASSMNLYAATNLSPPVAWAFLTNATEAGNPLALPLTSNNVFYRLQVP